MLTEAAPEPVVEPIPKRLAINVPLYAIRHTEIGGTEFSIYNLIKGLAQNDARVSVTYGRDADLAPEFLSWLQQHPEVAAECRGGIPGPKSVRFLEEFLFSLRPTDDDWVLFPNYFCPPRRRSSRRRRCVILHDIQYKVFPQYHSAKRRAWLDTYLPRMFRDADRIMLISQSEARLVREHFGDEIAAKCDVVPNAIDWSRFGQTATPLPETVQARLRHRYILSVCHLFPHKNVGTLLKAFIGIAANDPDIRLYLVGALSERNQAFIRGAVPDDIINRVEILGFVDDRTLGAYYTDASLFVLPSLYEGFGMPAVEAMGLGVPTLVSRCFSLPEVTLGQARYVEDPLEAAEWQIGIEACLAASPGLPDVVVSRIRDEFSPAAVGERLLNVLHRD